MLVERSRVVAHSNLRFFSLCMCLFSLRNILIDVAELAFKYFITTATEMNETSVIISLSMVDDEHVSRMQKQEQW